MNTASHIAVVFSKCEMVGVTGIEPATPAM